MNAAKLTLAVAAFTLSIMVQPISAQGPRVTHFKLAPRLLNCLARFPGDTAHPPTADVTVTRGNLNDFLFLRLSNIKPGLAFDLFTVERSNLLANGTPDPNFKNFGLAWYQSDIQVDSSGNAFTVIKTILLDQIFGFDPDVSLPPTNTFHVGFWFNNPNDAVPCGFNASNPTPFNGEHKAGPLAMISLPNATTGLGPLCTSPNVSTNPISCNP
jgi:hypothetical protein